MSTKYDDVVLGLVNQLIDFDFKLYSTANRRRSTYVLELRNLLDEARSLLSKQSVRGFW